MTKLDHIPFLNTLDRSIGRLLGARAEDGSSILEFAGALTSHALRQGHVCLDLNNLNQTDLHGYSGSDALSDLSETLRKNSLVGSETATSQPLILSEARKLYFHRYWHYEQRLILHLQDRLGDRGTNESYYEPGAPPGPLGKDQQKAVELAGKSNFTLISGGPGTGKTTTVLHILSRIRQTEQGRKQKIALAAPTGKAAQRIQESLVAGIESLDITEDIKASIPTTTSTLHRLLGYQRNSSQFYHNRNHPLPFDIVIVDEASMLDLLLFSKLLEAIKPETRLILLGDSHQLASVEAGSIFGDLIMASRSNQDLKAHSLELRENFRFGDNSDLYRVCEYVKSGSSENAISLLNTKSNEVSLRELPTSTRLPAALERAVSEHFVSLTKQTNPADALSQMARLCILTPIRKGSYGVEGINTSIETTVRNQQPKSSKRRSFHGQPILITENDYNHGLFNGDVGIIMHSKEDPDSLFAYFSDEAGDTLRRYPLTSLPAFESAYAFTVHKSQGSEYRRVIFVLPSLESPILSRELIYTAVSRSRETVEIWGDARSLQQAIDRPTRRTSGILDYLSV